jgi:hypothetical protein
MDDEDAAVHCHFPLVFFFAPDSGVFSENHSRALELLADFDPPVESVASIIHVFQAVRASCCRRLEV